MQTPGEDHGRTVSAKERGLGRTQPAHTLTSNFQPPESWEDPLPQHNPPSLWFCYGATLIDTTSQLNYPCMYIKSLRSCPTLCDPMDCSLPGASKRVAIPFSRESSPPKDWPCVSCIADGFFTTEPPGKPSGPHTCNLRKRTHLFAWRNS